MTSVLALVVLAQIATATPAPAKLGGGFGQKAPAVQKKARVIITADTLAPRRGTFVVANRPAVATPAAEIVDEGVAWRERVARLRADLAQAQADYDAASAANTVISYGAPDHDYQTLMAIRNAALSPYNVRLTEIQRELARLPEECRTSPGCQPGWVR